MCAMDFKRLSGADKDLHRNLCMASLRLHLQSTPHGSFALCPIDSCQAVLSVEPSSFQRCHACAHAVCVACGCINDELHQGATCAEFERRWEERERKRDEAKRMGSTMSELVTAAQDFVKQKWSIQHTLRGVEPSACLSLTDMCPGLDLFMKGVTQVRASGAGSGSNSLLSLGSFSWHGSAGTNIDAIAHHNLDAGRRSGQVFGPGEYFSSNDPCISVGYCKGGGKMLCCFILNTPLKSLQNKGDYVVLNNPVDKSAIYCLPVLVVTFENGAHPHSFSIHPPKPFHIQVEEHDRVDFSWRSHMKARQVRLLVDELSEECCALADPGSLRARAEGRGGQVAADESDTDESQDESSSESAQQCHRWFWRKDDGTFEPYADSVNAIIEDLYGSGQPEAMTPPVLRFVDDKPQTYRIDFQRGLQVHPVTGFTRRIERRAVSVAMESATARWMFQERNEWLPYQSLIMHRIESAYQQFVRGGSQHDSDDDGGDRGMRIRNGASNHTRAHTVEFRTPGRAEQYTLDFHTMQQSNSASGVKRAVKRVRR